MLKGVAWQKAKGKREELDQGWKRRRKMERTERGRTGERMDRRQMGQEDRTTKDG